MNEGLLTLTQWLSPAFPLGSFAYSHGLEWAIDAGEVCSVETLQDWVTAVLRHGSGRTDAILLAHALAGDEPPEALAAFAVALAPSQERLHETMAQGRALLAVTHALGGQALADMPYPVALGLAARGLGVPVAQVLALFLQAFSATLVQAAVRFVPLGQTDGQRVLSALRPVCLAVAEEAALTPLTGIGSGALRSDMAAMQHETMDVRIFRT
jgi:urease accessory protein